MPAWLNQSNLVVELGGNPLRLHCMPVKGFRCWSNLTGQIRPVKLGG